MNILEEFRHTCKLNGFEVVAIASGLALVKDLYGEVIITLPTKPMGVSDSSRLYREVRARSRRGRFGEIKDPHRPRAMPASLMTWEEYNDKFDGADSREETGS